ncbi:hypothetical protein MRX96_024107 [Rhipicephalus microplus]
MAQSPDIAPHVDCVLVTRKTKLTKRRGQATRLCVRVLLGLADSLVCPDRLLHTLEEFSTKLYILPRRRLMSLPWWDHAGLNTCTVHRQLMCGVRRSDLLVVAIIGGLSLWIVSLSLEDWKSVRSAPSRRPRVQDVDSLCGSLL